MAIRVGLAVCFMPSHFDRIVLPSLPNRYALDGLVVSVNHDHVPLGRRKPALAYPVVSVSHNRLGSAFRRRLGEVGRTSYVFVVRGFTPGPEAEQGPKG